ncbi:MAG: lipopolysaccharide heptosyltransferase II, partial [Actinobacteria bacterium]
MGFTTENIKKILIIKLAAIGDIMFASPLAFNLKKDFPEAEIHWLGDSWTKDTLKHIPNIDKLVFFDRPWFKSRIRGYLEIPRLLRKLRAQNYDLAIIAHRSPLAMRLAKLSNAKIKVGFVENGSNKYLDFSVKYDNSKHEVERNLDLLRALNLKIHNNRMIYEIDPSALSNMKEKYFNEKANGIVCIAPGGGKNPGLNMPLKKWPKERYADLAKELAEKGVRILLLGSKDDEDVCDFIAQRVQVKNLCSKTSLEESAALIKLADLYIGNDSGPLYIAAAVGTPTLGIFGPTDPKLLAPSGKNNTFVLNKVDCAPCYRPDQTVQGEYAKCKHDHVCMTNLSVEKVFKRAIELFEVSDEIASSPAVP